GLTYARLPVQFTGQYSLSPQVTSRIDSSFGSSINVVKRTSVEIGTMSVSWYETVRLTVLGSPASTCTSAALLQIQLRPVKAKTSPCFKNLISRSLLTWPERPKLSNRLRTLAAQ